MPELIVSLKGRELSRHTLGQRTRIGRDPSLEVVIDNPGVSRHHATVMHEQGRYLIRDEQSQNGMFVSEQRVTEHALGEANVVQLGKFALTFSGLADAPQDTTDAGSSVRPRAPGMSKTFALNAVEVQSVLAAHAGRNAAEAAPPAVVSASSSKWMLAAGLALLAAVLAVGVFVMR
jgi:pSer/pThr/pTyr-binding forkhead associated (FHA) protein